jgi:hypothetical protein
MEEFAEMVSAVEAGEKRRCRERRANVSRLVAMASVIAYLN